MSGVTYCCNVPSKALKGSPQNGKRKQNSDFELRHLASYQSAGLCGSWLISGLAIWLTIPHCAQWLNKMHSPIFWSAHSFFIAFMTKLSLHMSALPSDLWSLLQVNMTDGEEKWGVREQALRVRSHQILLYKANLKATILPNAWQFPQWKGRWSLITYFPFRA